MALVRTGLRFWGTGVLGIRTKRITDKLVELERKLPVFLQAVLVRLDMARATGYSCWLEDLPCQKCSHVARRRQAGSVSFKITYLQSSLDWVAAHISFKDSCR